jgi:putative glycosyl hydrolase-like family 15 (GHL15) protein
MSARRGGRGNEPMKRCGLLAALMVAAAVSGTTNGATAASPARIFQLVSRTEYSPEEWTILTRKASAVISLDNSGNDFPGALPQFVRDAPGTPVYTFADSLAVFRGWCDVRFAPLDVDEPSFFHSSEPASMVAQTQGASSVGLYWHADAREDPQTNVKWCADRNYYKTVSYVVESAATPGGAYTTVAQVAVQSTGTSAIYPIYRWSCSSCSPSRYYRVSSRLSDGRTVPYSWALRPVSSSSAILWVALRPAGAGLVEIEASVKAQPLPAPSTFVIEGQDRYDKTRFYQLGTATSLTPQGGAYGRYKATIPLNPNSNIRVRLGSLPYPADNDSILYTGYSSRRNNRSLTKYDSMVLRPTSPVLRGVLATRAQAALDLGADGVLLDFVHDNVGRLYSGLRSGNLIAPISASEQSQFGPGYKAAVNAMLDGLQASVPGASFLFNGLYVASSMSTVLDDFLPRTEGMFVEYFAFDNLGRNLDDRIRVAFETLIAQSHQRGKLSLLATRGAVTDLAKRRIGLALYLLISHPNVMWQYSTMEYYKDVTWLPEFEIPLGQPLVPALAAYSDLYYTAGSDALLRRKFANGVVIYNHGTTTRSVDLGEPLRPLLLQSGAYSLGIAVSRIDLAPKDGAILLRNP